MTQYTLRKNRSENDLNLKSKDSNVNSKYTINNQYPTLAKIGAINKDE